MHPFVALDFETANEHRGSACSVALVKFDEHGEETDRFSTLLHPHESLDYFNPINTWIHGITADHVANAPSWNQVHSQVIDFIGNLPLVAHNMAFDGYVLTDLDRIYENESLKNRRYCTVRLARKLFPEMSYRGLEDVFEHYFPNDSFNHHEASADAWACGKIFVRMQEERGIEAIDELCPPTGPGASREKHIRNGRKWMYTPSTKVELEELLERFHGTESLHGHHVTFTGTMETAQRSIMQELVTQLGGVIEKSTTKKTTILVMGVPNPASWVEGASGSRKLQKATKLREAGSPITVMSEKDFLNFLHDGQH